MEKPPILDRKEFSFTLTRDFMKRRARCYISGTSFRFVFICCISAALFGLAGIFLDPDPHRHKLHILLVLFPVWPIFLYGRWYLRLSKIRHEDIDRKVTVRIDNEGLATDYGDTATTLRWQSIKRLWKFPDVYLVFLDAQLPLFITLPIGDLADETKMFIETKVKEHRGEIINRKAK